MIWNVCSSGLCDKELCRRMLTRYGLWSRFTSDAWKCLVLARPAKLQQLPLKVDAVERQRICALIHWPKLYNKHNHHCHHHLTITTTAVTTTITISSPICHVHSVLTQPHRTHTKKMCASNWKCKHTITSEYLVYRHSVIPRHFQGFSLLSVTTGLYDTQSKLVSLRGSTTTNTINTTTITTTTNRFIERNRSCETWIWAPQ